MKKYVHLMLVAFLGQGVCTRQSRMSSKPVYFHENAKVKNYAAAYEPWLKVKSQCIP